MRRARIGCSRIRGLQTPQGLCCAHLFMCLELDAIAAGQDLSAAKLALWTHFFPSAQGDENELVAADVNADTSLFASLKEGPQVRGFYRQVQALQQAPDIGARSFELAQLRIPALHVKAAWLKDKAGTGGRGHPGCPNGSGTHARKTIFGFGFSRGPSTCRRVCNCSHRSTQRWVACAACCRRKRSPIVVGTEFFRPT